MKQNAYDTLNPTQKQILSLLARAKSHRQIAQTLDISLSYVGVCAKQIKEKLGIRGEAHSALTHWYWTQGPGFQEARMACLQDTLRELTLEAAAVAKAYQKLVAQKPA